MTCLNPFQVLLFYTASQHVTETSLRLGYFNVIFLQEVAVHPEGKLNKYYFLLACFGYLIFKFSS